ncbi:MAG: bifunctional DNA-formamidopyrimidine glycosylase/DNA-(apurinic or apyrimidinic site) lyase [Pseudomonadota bacterium]
MPELPEVETTRRGLLPHVQGRCVVEISVHQARLRYLVPADMAARLQNAHWVDIRRRAKYLLFDFTGGSVLVHLGMSGSLRIDDPAQPRRKHDHVCIRLDSGIVVRLHDPRRFGLMVWAGAEPLQHPLLDALGPEPLEDAFSGAHLAAHARVRKVSVKAYIMDQTVCVGVGNIYASEALFRAGIHPLRAANRVSAMRYVALADAIRQILAQAIDAGGTTLRDFLHADGNPGYFKQQLLVYGRSGEACRVCGNLIRNQIVAQRNTFWCTHCQR